MINRGAMQQPQFGMPLNFYENQTSHASASQFQLAPSASETDKAGQPGASTSTRIGAGAQSSARVLRIDYGASVNRTSVGHNTVLPNPPKSPSQIPTFNVAPDATTTDFNEALNQLKEDLTKSIESSLGVQIKPSKNAYHKLYPSTFDSMKAPDRWRVPHFQKFSDNDSKSTMDHISMFLAELDEASAYDFMKVRNFPLSLTSTTFSWFTSLPSCSIGSWAELEEKFHNQLMKLDCLTLHRFIKDVMNLSLIFFSNGSEKSRTDVFI
jgi:hypothetical protein